MAEAARRESDDSQKEAAELRRHFDEQLEIMREMQQSLIQLERRLQPSPDARG